MLFTARVRCFQGTHGIFSFSFLYFFKAAFKLFMIRYFQVTIFSSYFFMHNFFFRFLHARHVIFQRSTTCISRMLLSFKLQHSESTTIACITNEGLMDSVNVFLVSFFLQGEGKIASFLRPHSPFFVSLPEPITTINIAHSSVKISDSKSLCIT